MCTTPKIDPEFKTLIPPLSSDERMQLEQNIISHGCKNALVLWNGVIIDGHNRFEICVEHGVEFEIVEMEFESRESVKLWILDEQLGRRNLNDAARIEIALMKEELLRELARKNQMLGGREKSRAAKLLVKKTNGAINVRKSMAADADVSEKTLQRYTQIKKDGDAELLQKVKSGELKIGTAHKMLTSQIMKHLKIATQMYKYIQKHTRADDEGINNRLLILQDLLNRLCEKLEGVKHAEN